MKCEEYATKARMLNPIDNDDHQRRAPYNSSCVTANITDPGSKFKDVPDVCSIYISKRDFLGKGKTTYHVERVIHETGDIIDNGFCEVYVNAQIKEDGRREIIILMYQDKELTLSQACKCLGISEEEFLALEKEYY